MTTHTLANSTTTTVNYGGSGVTLVNAGVQGAPGASGLNYGFEVTGNNDTLINNGIIFGQRSGIYLTGSGGRVINEAGKTITATEPDQAGVNFPGSSGIVNNYGVISGLAGASNGSGAEAVIVQGGTVTNTGTLWNGGVDFGSASGTLVNAGLILGNNAYGGVYIAFGGRVTNLSGGVISADGATVSFGGASAYGVSMSGGAGTVTNAGTINGSSGFAVKLATNFTNRLIVDPGAVFVGTVTGGTAVDATLELASGASTGTFGGFGTQFTNFGTITFDPSASWLLAASTAISSTVINGFTVGDTIDLTGFAATSEAFASNALVLTSSSNGHFTLGIHGAFNSGSFALTAITGGTDITEQAAVTNLIISQTYTTGRTLVSANNPVTVTPTGSVTDTSHFAANYGRTGSAWTITNSGQLIGANTSTLNAGIALGTILTAATVASGVIVNNAGGVISGGGTASSSTARARSRTKPAPR